MKNLIFRCSHSLLIVLVSTGFMVSCTYKNVVYTDVTYPDQNIYMSQASATLNTGGNGIYYPIFANIQDAVARFSIDKAAGKLNVPLGVIKSGIDLSGSIQVSIAASTDTITKMIAAGKFLVTTDPTLTTEILPSSAFTLPASVTIVDGSANGSFNMVVDLNFLINSQTNTPKKRYAIAVGIANPNSKTIKSNLSTTIIFIDPNAVIIPVANFSNNIDNVSKTANFVNTSSNGLSYSWNYGDGSALETTTSPSHKYSASGTYSVTLSTTGVTGATVFKTTSITIL